MRTAARAYRRILPAQQTLARRQPDFRARNIRTVRTDYIDIQQAAHCTAILQQAQPALDLRRIAGKHKHSFRTGLFVNIRFKEHLSAGQHRADIFHAPCKRTLDFRRRLHRARHVHRQAHKRRPRIARKHCLLHKKARLPRLHHIRYRYFDICAHCVHSLPLSSRSLYQNRKVCARQAFLIYGISKIGYSIRRLSCYNV